MERFITASCFLILLGWTIPFVPAQETAGVRIPQGGDSFITLGDQEDDERAVDFQIKVEAPTPAIRNSFHHYSRELQRDFNRVLHLSKEQWEDRWSIPLHIQIQGKDTDEFEGGRYVVTKPFLGADNRFHIYVYVKLHQRFEDQEFARGFIKAMLLEQMLRPHAGAPGKLQDRRISVPEWMIYGFEELINHKRNGRPSAFFAGYLKSGQLLGVDKIISESNAQALAPMSRSAFQASSSALVEALVKQPGGTISMRSVLYDLVDAGSGKTHALLRQHFPGFREVQNGVDKWWALQVAILGQQQSFEFFSPERTDELVSRALTVRFEPAPKKVENSKQPFANIGKGKFKFLEKLKQKNQAKSNEPLRAVPTTELDEGFVGTIDQFALYAKRPRLQETLKTNISAIQEVKRLGFPLYRPLMQRYEIAIDRIVTGKTEGLDQEFANLLEMRAGIRNSMQQARDYLNYYEATAAPTKSQAFDDYRKLRRNLEDAGFPQRKDRISRYLDDLDAEFR